MDEVYTNDVEFEDEKESEDEEEIESASDDEDEDAGDDVSENCSEKDDELLEFTENVEGMEPNSEKRQRLVIFWLFFQLNPSADQCFPSTLRRISVKTEVSL